MSDLFLYGTLRHLPLLDVVVGRRPDVAAARLDGHSVRCVAGQSFPVIVADAAGHVDGLLLSGLTSDEVARLDYYEGSFGYKRADRQLTGGQRAAVYFSSDTSAATQQAWHLADWVRDWGAVTVLAAVEYMDGLGRFSASEAAARYPQMVMRADTRQRAGQEVTPSEVRVGQGRDSIQTQEFRRPYSNFFTVEEHDIRFPRFDASISDTVTRAALVGGDAVTVVPYDPVRDRVMVVEQFWIGPHIRGDRWPWTLEPIAGRIDPGETPEQAAHREMQEEAGLTVSKLLPVANYYPSPGAWTEYLYTFVGIADLPDSAAGTGGLIGEGEDIKSHILDFADAMELVTSGEADTGPLVLTLLWLQGQRDLIRQGA